MAKPKVNNGRDWRETQQERVAESAAIQLGSVIFGPAVESVPAPPTIPWKSPQPPVNIPTHPLVGVEPAIQMFGELQRFRDTKGYKEKGFHCFREWAMAKFGEKFGGWLDDHL